MNRRGLGRWFSWESACHTAWGSEFESPKPMCGFYRQNLKSQRQKHPQGFQSASPVNHWAPSQRRARLKKEKEKKKKREYLSYLSLASNLHMHTCAPPPSHTQTKRVVLSKRQHKGVPHRLGMVKHSFNLRSRGKRISVSLRPPWSTQQVLRQPGLHRDLVSRGAQESQTPRS